MSIILEVTFELAWKTMKDYLESEGLRVNTPRETLKTAFQIGVIEDGHVWLDALTNCNLVAHTYYEAAAEELTLAIKDAYFPQLRKLYQKLSTER